VAAIRIRQLTSAEVCASADDFAQLLLDAHASGMALGLAPRLTPERATEEWLATAARLDPDDRVL
jgi:hypothetical protein